MGEHTDYLGFEARYFNLAEIGCNADGAIQRNVQRCSGAITENLQRPFQLHGFVPSIDVGQGQGRDANFIAQVTIAIALDHGNVCDLDRLSQNGDARKTATLIKLPLALFLLGLPDNFAALLPLSIAHDRPWLRSGREGLWFRDVSGDTCNDNRADINVAAQ